MTLPEDATPADIERAVAKHGFSRYVLVDDDGEPTGYVHLKDVIDLDEDEYNEPVPPKRIRQLISVFRDQDLEDALATMRRAGATSRGCSTSRAAPRACCSSRTSSRSSSARCRTRPAASLSACDPRR